jgi:hypothetical protein
MIVYDHTPANSSRFVNTSRKALVVDAVTHSVVVVVCSARTCTRSQHANVSRVGVVLPTKLTPHERLLSRNAEEHEPTRHGEQRNGRQPRLNDQNEADLEQDEPQVDRVSRQAKDAARDQLVVVGLCHVGHHRPPHETHRHMCQTDNHVAWGRCE